MNTHLIICYKVSLAYFISRYNSSKTLQKIIESPEEFAIEVTASLFRNDDCDNILFRNEDAQNSLENELNFQIYSMVKTQVDKAIQFELLKYDLIEIDEHLEKTK